MRTRAWVMVCWIGIASSGALCAQSEKDAERGFEKSVMGAPLMLRNFSAETVVRARWTGSGVEFVEPIARMVGIVVVEEVKVRSKEVEISGKRYSAIRDKAAVWKPGPVVAEMKLVVAIDGGDKAAMLAGLRDGLFFATFGEAVAALPGNHGGSGPREDKWVETATHSATASTILPAGICDCADRETQVCKGLTPTSGWTTPKVMKMVDPEFSEEASAKKRGGNVQVSLTVDSEGKATNVWIVTPAGFGLDGKAAEAARKYKFQAATCHDQRVSSVLYIELKFQVF